jgi:hypothetical protein
MLKNKARKRSKRLSLPHLSTQSFHGMDMTSIPSEVETDRENDRKISQRYYVSKFKEWKAN